MYLFFGLFDINPNNNIDKISLKKLNHSKLSMIFANFLFYAILITFNF